MEIKYTEEELNSIDKSLLIKMFLNLQNQMETLTVETKALNDKMQKMMANNLKPYEYFEYLLTQIPAHMDDTDRSFLEDLLPWSPKLPEYIRKQKDRC